MSEEVFTMDYSDCIDNENAPSIPAENEKKVNCASNCSVTRMKPCDGREQPLDIFSVDMLHRNLMHNMEVTYASMKENRHIANQLYLYEKKLELTEKETERKKSQVEVLNLDENGLLSISTKNTRLEYPSRVLANFSKPYLRKFYNLDTNEICFFLTVSIGDKKSHIALTTKEAGNGKILVKKLNAIGAEFLAEKESKRISYATQLWSLLCRGKIVTIDLPNRAGWYKDKTDKICFCKREEDSWQILKRYM